MTNEENLQQHNDELTAIKILLDKKTIAINNTTKVFEIELPEEFSQCTNIYTYEVDSNTVLISGSGNSIYTGLWKYNVNKKEFKLLLDIDASIGSNFVQSPKNQILMNTSKTIIIYNIDTDTIDIIESPVTISGWLDIYLLKDNKYMITNENNSMGILLLDLNNLTISLIYNKGRFTYLMSINDKYLVTAKDGPDYGLLLIDLDNNIINKIYNKGYQWYQLKQINDTKWLIWSGNYTGYGILLFDSITETITELITEGYNWSTIIEFSSDKWLISSNNSSTKGILLLDLTNYNISKIYENGYKFEYYAIINDRCVISSTNTTLVLYDNSTNSIVELLTAPYRYITKVTDDKVYISDYNSPNLYVYKYSSNELILISNKSEYEATKQLTNNKWFLTGRGSDYDGFMIYNSDDDTLEQPLTLGKDWECINQVDNKCLIKSTASADYNSRNGGLYTYLINESKLTKIYNLGINYNIIIFENNNCYFKASDYTRYHNIFYYNSEDDSVKIVGYKMEVSR